mmetsp:Transcript_19750/g.49142  ORF Transcript_19750/g.49142 Transcript_19750/m.49142 type:complete len:143 (+) Transcript_19750:162-590(+)|eukprot:CAMPEP_0116095152 /NCGR_PEP_ID=MMETSP0327-20121206/9512_1 /TAXON_ID=44447 /ORGANISM="Pseudo-nitzschia delicatissima, Strain B596" /LENGTH=142 /DNA_ID=CAMNT_0003586803 /DNA_START=96 /DNA_END=524 /DNA_ORIENTATION=-
MAYFNKFGYLVVVAVITTQAAISQAFTIPQAATTVPSKQCVKSTNFSPLFMADTEAENQVVELADDDESEDAPSEEKAVAAPFLSQGEIDEEALTMDWSDPKQQRVMFYIILSLIPVLFLIPLMLGSRELIPMDMLPPVELN